MLVWNALGYTMGELRRYYSETFWASLYHHHRSVILPALLRTRADQNTNTDWPSLAQVFAGITRQGGEFESPQLVTLTKHSPPSYWAFISLAPTTTPKMLRSALTKTVLNAARPSMATAALRPVVARGYHENVIAHYENPKNVKWLFST